MADNPTGNKPIGRTRLRWRKNIRKDCNVLVVQARRNIMMNINKWRHVLNAATTHKGLWGYRDDTSLDGFKALVRTNPDVLPTPQLTCFVTRQINYSNSLNTFVFPCNINSSYSWSALLKCTIEVFILTLVPNI